MGVPNGAPEASGRGVRQRKPKAADGFVVELPIRKVGPTRRPRPGRPDEVRRANLRPLTCAFDASVLPPDELSPDPEESARYSNGMPKPAKRGAWAMEEDEVLMEAVAKIGQRKWNKVACSLPGRIAKQCRERWHNHLKPDICKEPWAEQEDLMIQLGVLKHGHKWSTIARSMPGRTDNQIKNRYNCTVQKYGTEKYQNNGMSTKAFLDELKRRNARTELEAVPLMQLANPRFHLKNTWSPQEVSKLQDAMRRAQDDDSHQVDWGVVAFIVGDRSARACRAQWSRMCQAWGSKERAADPPPPSPPPPPEEEPIPVESDSALTMMAAPTDTSEEDEFVSSAGEAAWNEIKLMCFEEYDEGSATDPRWTRSFQWDVPAPETRQKKPISFNFRHPSRPLQLALHMFDVRRHLIPTYRRGKWDSPPKMTEYYMEKKRRLEEEEALVKSVLA
jgi:hypothetical protein